MFIGHLYLFCLDWFFISLIHFSINTRKHWAYNRCDTHGKHIPDNFSKSSYFYLWYLLPYKGNFYLYGFWNYVMMEKISSTLISFLKTSFIFHSLFIAWNVYTFNPPKVYFCFHLVEKRKPNFLPQMNLTWLSVVTLDETLCWEDAVSKTTYWEFNIVALSWESPNSI